jgi:hypothetical protein
LAVRRIVQRGGTKFRFDGGGRAQLTAQSPGTNHRSTWRRTIKPQFAQCPALSIGQWVVPLGTGRTRCADRKVVAFFFSPGRRCHIPGSLSSRSRLIDCPPSRCTARYCDSRDRRNCPRSFVRASSTPSALVSVCTNRCVLPNSSRRG